MKPKDKESLLKYLCAILPYDVHCCVFNLNGSIKENDDILYGVIGDNVITLKSKEDECLMYYQIKPYLRPMSSMTEEEKNEIDTLLDIIGSPSNVPDEDERIIDCSYECITLIDFYDSRYLDYRGFIGKGLALEAPEDMYK